MSKKRKKQVRTEFRKNRTPRARGGDLTRRLAADENLGDDMPLGERIGQDEKTRKRTVLGEAADEEAGLSIHLTVDETTMRRGRVLSVHGLTSVVQDDENKQLYKCATRRLLKTLTTDQRHVVAAGDRVLFRPASNNEGLLLRIEPRFGLLSRLVRGRQQILVANVERMIVVGSAAEPYLKPNLIDRFLISAEKGRIRPVICINKIDLVEPQELEPLVGVYSRMGYEVLLVSAATGFNIERLRRVFKGRESVIVGQSGVGKSSLLNAIDPQLKLRTAAVSTESQKGRHTTTTARLVPLADGGYVVDTPGIRQFNLWDVIPAEVAGFFRDLRPYVSQCKFPNCTHTHEAECAVKDAVADGRFDARRYESYCRLYEGDMD